MQIFILCSVSDLTVLLTGNVIAMQAFYCCAVVFHCLDTCSSNNKHLYCIMLVVFFPTNWKGLEKKNLVYFRINRTFSALEQIAE